MNLIFKKLKDNQGAALMMAILVFTIVVLFSSILTMSLTNAIQIETKQVKQQQAYYYAKSGLNMAYKYFENLAQETGGVAKVLKYVDKEFTGTVDASSINYSSELEPDVVDKLPTEFNGFTIKVTRPSNDIIKVTSTSNYAGQTSTVYRYLYYTSTPPQNNKHAIDSVGYINIASNVGGSIRGSEVVVAGKASYAGIFSTGKVNIAPNGSYVEIKSQDGTGDKVNILSHTNIDMTTTVKVDGVVAAGGYVNFTTFADAVYANYDPTCYGSNNNGGYALTFTNYNTVGSLSTLNNSSTTPIAIYSGGNAKINGTIYGDIIVNGDLTVDWCDIYGNIYCTGNIINPERIKTFNSWIDVNGNTITPIKEENLSLSELSDRINMRTYYDVEAIDQEVDYNEVRPKTQAPSSCDNIVPITDIMTEYQTYNFIHVQNSCTIVGQPSDAKATILYLDAGSQNIDVKISGDWYFASMWSKPSQIVVNDNSGNNRVRLFLDEGTNIVMGKNSSDGWCMVNQMGYILPGDTIDPNNYPDTGYGHRPSNVMVYGLPESEYYLPEFYIFSLGESDSTNGAKFSSYAGNIRGYWLGYNSSVHIPAATGQTRVVGKITCQNIYVEGNSEGVVVYSPPDNEKYQDAIKDIFTYNGGGSSSGSAYLKPTLD